MEENRIKRIIFLLEFPFNLRDYQRFGINLLQENGFHVEVWDLSFILNPELLKKPGSEIFHYEGWRRFNNKQEACHSLKNMSQADYVISLVTYRPSALWVYMALSKSRTKGYAVFYANTLPVSIAEKGYLDGLRDSVKKLLSLRRLELWKRLFMKLPFRYMGVRPANLILAGGGNSCKTHFYYPFPVDMNAEVLYIHTLDYDIYLREKGIPCHEKDIAVFLDEYMPSHSDSDLAGRPSINGPKYYQLLNDFFNRVEKKTGLEVVIAAHPRSRYEDILDCFRGRRCIKGKTANLIKEGRLVLAHGSTALNFANLFYKPVIFLMYSDLERSWECEWRHIREMARWHGKKPIYMDSDNNINWEEELAVKRRLYDDYRKAYIKKDNSEEAFFWQVVSNRFKRGFLNEKSQI